METNPRSVLKGKIGEAGVNHRFFCVFFFFFLTFLNPVFWQPTPVFLPGEPAWTEEPGRLHSVAHLETTYHDVSGQVIHGSRIC